MPLSENLQNKFHCICGKMTHFEIIDDIECNWGSHTVIQCPKYEELFSIDCECPAFQSILKLYPNYPNNRTNPTISADTEIPIQT